MADWRPASRKLPLLKCTFEKRKKKKCQVEPGEQREAPRPNSPWSPGSQFRLFMRSLKLQVREPGRNSVYQERIGYVNSCILFSNTYGKTIFMLWSILRWGHISCHWGYISCHWGYISCHWDHISLY